MYEEVKIWIQLMLWYETAKCGYLNNETKKGKNSKNCLKYWPIYLLELIAKNIWKIINQRLKTYLEDKKKLINDLEFRFRTFRSIHTSIHTENVFDPTTNENCWPVNMASLYLSHWRLSDRSILNVKVWKLLGLP